MFEEYGFGTHGPRAARTSQSGDRRQQMQKQDGEIAHRTIVSRSRHRKNPLEFCNSPRTRIQLLKKDGWVDNVGPGTEIEILVREPSTLGTQSRFSS